MAAAISLAAGTFAPFEQSASLPVSVSRADTGTIALPEPIPLQMAEPVSQFMRTPVRVAEKAADTRPLTEIVRDGLSDLGYEVTDNDRLYGLLVKTLAEGQSDAYIEAALNAALARGDFKPVPGIVDAQGGLQADTILKAVLEQVRS